MRLLVILVFILLYINCKKKDDFINNRLKNITLEYNDYLKKTKISSELMNHFPFKITSLPIKLYSNIEGSEGIIYNMLFEFNIKKTKIDSINNVLKAKNVSKHLSSDSNLIVIKRKTLGIKDYKTMRVVNTVPFFETYSFYGVNNDVATTNDVYSSTSKSGLSKEFKIYILESNKGKYWEKLETKEYMPNEWGNGYSKGIAINDKKKIIIYWIVIW